MPSSPPMSPHRAHPQASHAHHASHPHRVAQRNTMPPRQVRALIVVLLALVASGAGWMVVHWLHWPAASLPAMEGLPSPWEAPLMRLHGGAMMLMLVLAGRVSATHAQRGWRLKLRRRGGLWMVACLSALALSGYLLFYWVPEDWRDPVGLCHGALGLLWALSFAWHRRRLAPPSGLSSRSRSS